MEENIEVTVTEKENRNKKNVKNLLLAGTLSALAGLGGCLVLGLLLAVGFVASISGIVITLAMYYTFQKFYKTKSKWLYVYIVGVAIIEIFLTVLIADGLVIKSFAYVSENIILTLGESISLIFSTGELIGAFIADFLLAVLFALIGIGIMIFDLVQKQKRKEMIMSTLSNDANKKDDTVYTPATVVETKGEEVKEDKSDDTEQNKDKKDEDKVDSNK